MSYTHGVYTSEVETSVIPVNDAPSCVPFIIGYVKAMNGVTANTAVMCSSWSEYQSKFPCDDAVTGLDMNTCDAFARHWFTRCKAGPAIFVPLAATGGTDPGAPLTITSALATLDNCYEQFSVVPTVIACPRYGSSFVSAMVSAAQSFGGQWSAIVVMDLSAFATGDTPTTDLKLSSSEYCVVVAGRGTSNGEYIDGSSVFIGALSVTDSNIGGGFPYVSPSNQIANIDGAVDYSNYKMFYDQTKANAWNAVGIVTFLHNSRGWVVWGDETAAFPDNTDIKDQFISVRRTFLYLKNDFISYAQARVDLPLNNRQIEGIIKSYGTRLNGLVANGIICGGSIEYREADNTTTDLLNGSIRFHISIAPPPPMRTITGIFEYDVELFTSSLA